MKSLQQWLDEYGESHQNLLNIAIHWVCVPLIFWSITGFLFLVTIPVAGNLAVPALLLTVIYYLRLSVTLSIGMLIFAVSCLWLCLRLFILMGDQAFFVFAGVFAIAWIFQFYGHKVEGRKPSFLKDIQFLLIGPAWLMVKLYRILHLPVK